MPPRAIILGICAMEKKAHSKEMRAILSQLERTGEFIVTHFPEATIRDAPVEEWPHPIDVLISFFSEGFPLHKAEAYVALRQPHCINDVAAQNILLDRRKVYALLKENYIPHPQAIVVERDPATGALVGLGEDEFYEADDYLQIGSQKICKPFVEKPIDAEDHNICLYYPGGGVKSLFRKVGDKSSDFEPHRCDVRRDGSYMYEPFMKTQGTDIKVYTVGTDYAHAEARKSPVIDGKVNRNKDGKEVRTPVVLTPAEKSIAKRVCLAFGQMVCGFDLLRTSAGSFVIDVNGWSFVKGVKKYYEDAAIVLRAHMLQVTGRPATLMKVHSMVSNAEYFHQDSQPEDGDEEPPPREDRWEHEELLAVLAVMRHGDRTPKNKMKLTSSRPEFIELHRRWASNPQKEVKLKTPKQLQDLLDTTNAMLTAHNAAEASGSEAAGSPDLLDKNHVEKLTLVNTVLQEGGHFDGIYRKAQLKPLKRDETEQVQELVIVLKYGGILTHAGLAQAEALGHQFRGDMYPGESEGAERGSDGGLLRLHATQRHDFKVYSSDEGRVQMSAAAFTRGLLDLGSDALTPIAFALVETDPAMLDDVPAAAEKCMRRAKEALYEKVTGCPRETPKARADEVTFSPSSNMSRSFSECSSERWAVPEMHVELNALVLGMDAVCRELEENRGTERPVEYFNGIPCKASIVLICARWRKLKEELLDKKKNKWNISKVPEIFDGVKFDLLHHPWLAPTSFLPLYETAKKLNDVIVPHEYGCDMYGRVKVGSTVCQRLLRKLLADMNNCLVKRECVETDAEKPIVTAKQFFKNVSQNVSNWITGKLSKPSEEPLRADDLPKRIEEDTAAADEEAEDGEDAEDAEDAEFAVIDPRHAADLKSPNRCVRTRLYFTSESHIQTLMNVLRYCHRVPEGMNLCSELSDDEDMDEFKELDDVGQYPERGADTTHRGIVCPEAEASMRSQPVFDYLTQIVFRLYEDKKMPQGSAERFRVEVLFSPGAIDHPSARNAEHQLALEPLQPLHTPDKPLTLLHLQRLFNPLLVSAKRNFNRGGSSTTFRQPDP
mmetsp:Transcript_103871/g.294270  ORF Transcript_103871/g.294270 Transcript_103871/m.294270 type:complete len:1058 (+) Transcript_103871:42-3215(+)